MAKRNSADSGPSDPFRNWHRLFGLMLSAHLEGSPFTVETEVDLSKRRQLLDVVVVRRGPGVLTMPMPDGLDDFVEHNLLTFKSFHEPLDDWALKELTGHYVNYRKGVSERDALLSEDLFRLYAVCARTPRDLMGAIAVETVRPGVYHCRRGTDTIRIIVAAELPFADRNAMLLLFSAANDRIEYGRQHYELRSQTVSTVVHRLFENYAAEGVSMPYTIDDLKKEIVEELSVEERLRGLRPQQRLQGLKLEERLQGLKPEEVLKFLTPAQIEAYLRRVRKESTSGEKKKRKPKK